MQKSGSNGCTVCTDCICKSCSCSTFPFSDVQVPISQAWLEAFIVVTPRLHWHHDRLHQGVLTILCIWCVSAVYKTPCFCSIGFFNGTDKGSQTPFIDQSLRAVHMYAAFQRCFSWRLHCCQGDRISFCFAFLYQRLRDRTDQAHVDTKTVAKDMVFCIVSIERWRLARASQVFEQICAQRFRHWEELRFSEDLRFFTKPGPLHARLRDDSITVLVSEKSLLR